MSVFWEEEGQTENVRLLVILVKRLDVLWLCVCVQCVGEGSLGVARYVGCCRDRIYTEWRA